MKIGDNIIMLRTCQETLGHALVEFIRLPHVPRITLKTTTRFMSARENIKLILVNNSLQDINATGKLLIEKNMRVHSKLLRTILHRMELGHEPDLQAAIQTARASCQAMDISESTINPVYSIPVSEAIETAYVAYYLHSR